MTTPEQGNIEQWRLTCLKEAGYDEESAKLIAVDFNIDLHVACDLLRKGATVEQALLILM